MSSEVPHQVHQNMQPVTRHGGDSKFVKLRDKATGGTITNIDTVLSAIVTDGVIDVAGCSAVSVYFDFDKGSLTNASFTPFWADKNKALFHAGQSLLETSAVLVMTIQRFRVAAALAVGYFTVMNPGASFFRLNLSSSGTVTGSKVGVWVSRHFAPVQNIMVSA